jgi:hypothetical protein
MPLIVAADNISILPAAHVVISNGNPLDTEGPWF